ncbi:MAG: hypothetical protein ETSY2_21830 [Candidatus Entotheonella gemina]|uniref:HNH nuclease domain-containing protein n=1 Tax=Candidatus Entotheonella gemina TaxID=1429439 RepID=W4M614_9BACT|nr:MAG: hypothetical protein ETSY2_21830 [Candidatus Entotheonella gemina]
MAARHRQLKADAPATKLTFRDHWNRPDVRGTLYARQGRICTYCGRCLPDNDKGDVEHFRPKGKVAEDDAHGGYWWLAYTFSNYLMSCSVCNRVYKRDRFPLRPGARQRVTFETRQRLRHEARLLVHPFDTDPIHGSIEQWLQVDWQETNCFIWPRETLSPKQRVQVQGTLDFFRINRSPRLIQERNNIRNNVLNALDQGDNVQVKQSASRFRPHSLIARQMIQDRQRLDLMPTPLEELRDFVLAELTLLDIAFRLLDQHPEDDSLKRVAQEQLWILVALWYDPPVATSSDAERFLPPMIQDRLRPYLNQFGEA